MTTRLRTAYDQLRAEQARVNEWHWFGYFTVENAPFVYERLRSMLLGKRYTWVAVNENLDLLHPEVRTGQRLSTGSGTWTDRSTDEGLRLLMEPLDDRRPHAHIIASDTYGVWSISTSIPDQRAAYEYRKQRRGAVGLHHMSDPELKGQDWDLVYLSLRGADQIEIYQRTAAGGRTTWVLHIEDDRHSRELLKLTTNLLDGKVVSRQLLDEVVQDATWTLYGQYPSFRPSPLEGEVEIRAAVRT